jgi:anti-sigma factor RsiW
MCDFQPKLVAWLDNELPQNRAAEVERHVQACQQCRAERDRYEQVGKTFDAYCDAVMSAKTHPNVLPWVPAVSGALLAVAATVLLFTLQRPRIDPRPAVTPAAKAAPARVLAAESVLSLEPVAPKKIHRRQAILPVREQVQQPTAKWQPPETAVQITIPAETMFAPGAIPEGMNFVAELSIGPDGSVERLRLRP